MPLELKIGDEPSRLLERIGNDLPDSWYFEIGKYKYIPKSLADYRMISKIKVKDFKSDFEKFCRTLGEGEEIAIQSRVYDGDRLVGQIPMIDLMCKPNAEEAKSIKRLMSDFGVSELGFFDSGRGFHCYGMTLFSADKLFEYFGRLLLVNDTSLPPLVDTRWVGHRMLAGYGALRLTFNSKAYKAAPTLIII